MVRGGKPKRAGDKDRNAITDHLREAFAAGYLKEPELQQRIDKAVEAVTMTDLRNLTEDLPSNAELTGKEKVPGRIRKFMVDWDWEDHPWFFVLTMTLGLIVAIMPSVVIGTAHMDNIPVFAALMVLTIILGTAGFVASMVALIARA